MLLVFAHLLASSVALGAIVATDLRLLSKLAQDRIRIAPPNEFVARIVMAALLMLYVTGAGIVAHGLAERPDYLSNPKLQAKLVLVILLTLNAFVLHKLTFPRLARGRRVARWSAADWVIVGVPVAVSNFLWMFVAFLGIARPWNYSMPMRDILEIAACLYLVAQCGVFAVLAMAGRGAEPDRARLADKLMRALAALGGLGVRTPVEQPEPRRPSRSRQRREEAAAAEAAAAELELQAVARATRSTAPVAEAELPLGETTVGGTRLPRPALRLVGVGPQPRRAAR